MTRLPRPALAVTDAQLQMELCLLYVLQTEDMQQQIIRETFHLVSKRDDNVCNFLEGGT